MHETIRPATPANPSRRQLAGPLALGLLLAGLSLPAQASDWPSKPVRLIVPFAAGGATDLLARALAVELGKAWKQSVVVDNRPGAGGGLGAELVAKSPADGSTLLLASGSMFTVNPFLYGKLPYGNDSFEMIGKVASGPMVVTVHVGVPANTLPQLIAHARAHPGRLTFGSAGNGSQVHMAGEAFSDAAGLQVVHVPYKGESQAYADLMAGTIQLVVGNIAGVSPLLKGGRLRALAVTGSERSAMLPDVPTAAEAGLPGFEFTGWFALMAPAGTPRDITARVAADLQQAVEQPGMKRYLVEQGMTATPSTGARLLEDIGRESMRWKELVARRGIRSN
jgi:tripartite-type tricarboxylate transporter receptor subunit TctC